MIEGIWKQYIMTVQTMCSRLVSKSKLPLILFFITPEKDQYVADTGVDGYDFIN